MAFILLILIVNISFICVAIFFGIDNAAKIKSLEEECKLRRKEVIFLARNISKESGIDITNKSDEDVIMIIDAVCSK